jgi:ribosome maturation factor RimP
VGLQPTFYLGQTFRAGTQDPLDTNPFGISRFKADFAIGPAGGLDCTGEETGPGHWCWPGMAAMAAKLDEIRSAAERVAASHGLEVVNVEFVGPAKERVLRVYLEKNAEGRAQLKAAIEAGNGQQLPERLIEGKLSVEQLSGVTHEDCAEFSRDFGVLLDVEDLVPGAEYTLEASSPGLDRKLSKAEDFERFKGCLVKVQTFEPLRNNRHWQGRLIAGPEGGTGDVVTLDLNAVKQNSKSRKAGVSTIEIALSNIERAQLVPEI